MSRAPTPAVALAQLGHLLSQCDVKMAECAGGWSITVRRASGGLSVSVEGADLAEVVMRASARAAELGLCEPDAGKG